MRNVDLKCTLLIKGINFRFIAAVLGISQQVLRRGILSALSEGNMLCKVSNLCRAVLLWLTLNYFVRLVVKIKTPFLSVLFLSVIEAYTL